MRISIKNSNIPPSLARIFRAMPLMLALLGALLIVIRPSFSPDMYWHLANGREMIQSGRTIGEEVFSFTHPGEQFENHEWLAQIIFYLIWQTAGFNGLFGLNLLTAALVVLLGYSTVRAMGGSPWLAALLSVFAVLAGMTRYTERPELFSLLLLALINFILYGHRAGRLSGRVIWLIPLIMVAWNSLHGAIFGLGFFSLFVVGENIKRFFPMLRRESTDHASTLKTLNLCYAVTMVAMLLDPFGLRYYGIFFSYLSKQTMPGISEFMPITSMMWQEAVPIIVMLTWAALLTGMLFRRIDITDLIILLVFGVFSLRYFRIAGITSIMLIPVIAGLMTAATKQSADRRQRMPSHIMTLLVAVFIVGFGYTIKFSSIASSHLAFGYQLVEDYYPVGSLRFAQAIGLSGNYYNSGNFGGYLSYFAAPERKIFQYNMPLFRKSGKFTDHPDRLRQWDINYAFVGLENELTILFPINQWARIYREPGCALVLRRTPENQALIQRHEMHFFNPLMPDDVLRGRAKAQGSMSGLIDEMGTYLAFREDRRIADLWAEIISANPDLRNQPRIQHLLKQALKYNGGGKLALLPG